MERARGKFVLGAVSYLNARPLIHGLQGQSDIDLKLDVPSGLLAGLSGGEFDVALLPVIDYQRVGGLKILKSGGIGSDGETLTVRIFSSEPIEGTKVLACDPDSHTSVALARIILAERFGIEPELVGLGEGTSGAAMLLIGDKVVTREPRGMGHQLDLGAAWKELTGLPFVFAVWTARGGVELGDLPGRLEEAKELGMKNLERIVEEHAVGRGWPRELAMRYLSVNLKFDVGERELAAMGKFFELSRKHGVITEVRRLEIY